jgi:hypothetical protein
MRGVANKSKDQSFAQAVEKTTKAFRYFTLSYTLSTLGAQEYQPAEDEEDQGQTQGLTES